MARPDGFLCQTRYVSSHVPRHFWQQDSILCCLDEQHRDIDRSFTKSANASISAMVMTYVKLKFLRQLLFKILLSVAVPIHFQPVSGHFLHIFHSSR